jgi:hypothetical protein
MDHNPSARTECRLNRMTAPSLDLTPSLASRWCIPQNSSTQYQTLRDFEFLSLGKKAQDGCLYNPADVGFANRHFNANCGPAAFAAITRRSICSVMKFFPKFPHKPWTTKGDMQALLRNASIEWTTVDDALPRCGLALIQLIGPWCRLRNPGAALSKTHWVGVYHDCFYDINWDGWLPKSIWEQLIYPALEDRHRGACGWKPLVGFQFDSLCFDVVGGW